VTANDSCNRDAGKDESVSERQKIVDVGEPKIKYCPLFYKMGGIKEVTPETVEGNMEFRIEKHGMFSSRRKLEMNTFVGFGTSVSMMTSIMHGFIDGAVTVCDGAGTVIAANPLLFQGMGCNISGLT
jgi:putative methanogenesis marker protein 8